MALDPYALVVTESIYLLGTHSRTALFYVIPPTCAAPLAASALRAVSAPAADMDADQLRTLVAARAGDAGETLP